VTTQGTVEIAGTIDWTLYRVMLTEVPEEIRSLTVYLIQLASDGTVFFDQIGLRCASSSMWVRLGPIPETPIRTARQSTLCPCGLPALSLLKTSSRLQSTTQSAPNRGHGGASPILTH
jgi:hypothetical protein